MCNSRKFSRELSQSRFSFSSRSPILKNEILVLVSKHEIEREKFSFSSRTRDQKKAILVPVSRIEKGFSSHTGRNEIHPMAHNSQFDVLPRYFVFIRQMKKNFSIDQIRLACMKRQRDNGLWRVPGDDEGIREWREFPFPGIPVPGNSRENQLHFFPLDLEK